MRELTAKEIDLVSSGPTAQAVVEPVLQILPILQHSLMQAPFAPFKAPGLLPAGR